MAKKTKTLSYHQRILALLADGDWHSFKDIHKSVARFVDPGAADAEYCKRHRNWEELKLPARVAAGKKRLVFLSLNTAIHHRKLVEAGSGRALERQYRLTKAAMKARSNVQPKKPEPTATTNNKAKPAISNEAKPATTTPAKKLTSKQAKPTTNKAKPANRKPAKPATSKAPHLPPRNEAKPTTSQEAKP